jgi:phosphatidate phosphatase APP1
LYQQLAAKKLSRFREFAAIYPEACFLLIGDSGQVRGDAWVWHN